VFDFRCIEGWSQITHWAGVPLKTFMDNYHLQDEEKLMYIGLQTPDNEYYVGIIGQKEVMIIMPVVIRCCYGLFQ